MMKEKEWETRIHVFILLCRSFFPILVSPRNQLNKLNMIIILIDDDDDDTELFEEAVREIDQSISFRAYKDGISAIEAIMEDGETPNVIFLDLNMPIYSGSEVLKKLRATSQGKDIPVVIYSTSINAKDVDELTPFEVSHFVTKPDSFEGLKHRLRQILF